MVIDISDSSWLYEQVGTGLNPPTPPHNLWLNTIILSVEILGTAVGADGFRHSVL